MKNLLLIFLLFSYGASGQSLHVDSTRFVGGDSSCGTSLAEYSIPTKDGGILFVGLTECFAGGGNIPASPPDTSSESFPSNILIGKLDSNLNVSWVKVYGGSWADYATGAVETTDGGYAVLGFTYSNNRDVSGNHGDGDLWLVRLDSLGNLLWQQCYGSPYDEQSGSIALTPDNGFIMFGISNGDSDEVPTHYGTEFNYNWFVVKTDSIGNMQWGKTIGGTGGEESFGSILVVNNAYYLVSSSNSTDYDCTDTAWCAGNGHGTGYNYYIFKLDTAGNILWDSSYGGPGGDIVYNAIWDNRDSSIVMTGITTANGYMVTSNDGSTMGMWVVKTDKNGVLKWENCLGASVYDEGQSIAIAPFGYVAYGKIDPGSAGFTDNWLFAIDDTGHILSNMSFGGTSYENQASIFPFKNGFAVTGGSSSPGFIEGTNLGPLTGDEEDAFIAYINYSPLGIINVNISNQQMTVYPNPADGIIKVVLPNEAGDLTIFNSIGENIYTIINKQNETIDIITREWAKGLYIAKWQGEDGIVLTKKLIIN